MDIVERTATDFDAAFGASFDAWAQLGEVLPKQDQANEMKLGSCDSERSFSLASQSSRLPSMTEATARSRVPSIEAGPPNVPSQCITAPTEGLTSSADKPAHFARSAISKKPELHGNRLIIEVDARAPKPASKKGLKWGQPELLSDDDINRFLAYVDEHSNAPARDRCLFSLPLEAGLRPCEVSGLLTRSLITATGDLLDNLIVMPGTAKRKKERHIPISARLRTELLRFFREYPDAERIAFHTSRDGSVSHLSPAAVSNWFVQIYSKVGLKGYSAMSGRHTFANRLYRNGSHPREIQQLLGHALLPTTRTYLRPQKISANTINRLGQGG